MILYWAYPKDGSGHATRAAAVCRHFDSDVLVIRGNDDPKVNRALDYYDIPYMVFPERKDATNFALEHKGKLVLDDNSGTVLDKHASIYIWRTGRKAMPTSAVPTVRIEGPNSLGPLLVIDESEILSKEEAREDLGLPQGKFLTFGIPCTTRPGAIEDQPGIDFLLDRWPAVKWMRGADHIIGTIGANLYGEVTYLGIPTSWVIAPMTRDQNLRSETMPAMGHTPDAAKRLAKIIEGLKK